MKCTKMVSSNTCDFVLKVYKAKRAVFPIAPNHFFFNALFEGNLNFALFLQSMALHFIFCTINLGVTVNTNRESNVAKEYVRLCLLLFLDTHKQSHGHTTQL